MSTAVQQITPEARAGIENAVWTKHRSMVITAAALKVLDQKIGTLDNSISTRLARLTITDVTVKEVFAVLRGRAQQHSREIEDRKTVDPLILSSLDEHLGVDLLPGGLLEFTSAMESEIFEYQIALREARVPKAPASGVAFMARGDRGHLVSLGVRITPLAAEMV